MCDTNIKIYSLTMNIFILSKNPRKSARWLCDQHLIKMIIEGCQMLYIAIWVCSDMNPCLDNAPLNSNNIRGFKRPKMFINHPCSIWVRESVANYNWLCEHTHEMCIEYEKRYHKKHKLTEHVLWLMNNTPRNIPSKQLTPFALAMPEIYKKYNDPIQCYRAYYMDEKIKFAVWWYSEIPWWYKERKLTKTEKFVSTKTIIVHFN